MRGLAVSPRRGLGARHIALQLLSAGLIAAGLVALPIASKSAGAALVRPHVLSPGSAPVGASAVGAVPGTQSLTVRLVLPPSNQAALTALLQAQQDPASAEFHHWLAPGQFRSEFGPAQSDVSAVTAWLRADGFSPSVSGYLVSVTAPESRFAGAFGVSFERYATPGRGTGYVASSAPLVPSSLASGGISSILGLNTTYKFMSQTKLGRPSPTSQSPHVLLPHADGLTPCPAATGVAGAITLDQEGAAYEIGSLLAAGENGTGETVGLYELGQSSKTDISTYESCFGLNNAFSLQNVDGGAASGTGGTFEADLDAEQAMTQAPGASVISYEGPNTDTGAYDVWNAIVTADAAQVVSTSWGLCEHDTVLDVLKGPIRPSSSRRLHRANRSSPRAGTRAQRTVSSRTFSLPNRSTTRRPIHGSRRSAGPICCRAGCRPRGTTASRTKASRVPSRMAAQAAEACRATNPDPLRSRTSCPGRSRNHVAPRAGKFPTSRPMQRSTW